MNRRFNWFHVHFHSLTQQRDCPTEDCFLSSRLNVLAIIWISFGFRVVFFFWAHAAEQTVRLSEMHHKLWMFVQDM